MSLSKLRQTRPLKNEYENVVYTDDSKGIDDDGPERSWCRFCFPRGPYKGDKKKECSSIVM